MIFNIQKCSIHDGDGLRTLVFFKGCPLRCQWCSNPESQAFEQEIMESPVRCIGCGACRTVCPMNAIREDGRIDRTVCNRCFQCVERCYAESRRIAGKEYTATELYEEIARDRQFYVKSGGGVTCSGGEPLAQPDFLYEIAKLCHEKGIHVMLESCGCGNYEEFQKALPYIDGMFLDIKIFDSVAHEQATGVPNETILNNIQKISECGIPVIIRTPIVPGYTDAAENIEQIAGFISGLPSVKEYELLAYHSFGESKYGQLGREYALQGIQPPSNENMQSCVKLANQILKKAGKECFWTNNNNREVIV